MAARSAMNAAGESPEAQMLRKRNYADHAYSVTEAYEAKLLTTKNRALFVAGLQKSSRFFGICALTWATVVLLGGFPSNLRPLDFYLVSILLLLEAVRLSTTRVFSKLLSKTLFREHHRPQEFQFKDLQYFWACRLDLLGQCCICLVAILGLVLAALRIRLHTSGKHPFTERDVPNSSNSNLTPSLFIFYVLVILNSATALASGVCRPIFRQGSDDSLLCYHDEVYKTAMNVGMPEADEINIFDFAFKKLANDHMRSIRPLTIKARNEDLIRYLYYSPNGVEVACECLKSSDVWKQTVAANLVGFWVRECRIEKQVALFWALQDKLYGAGKVAEAAANSIQVLGKDWAEKQSTGQHPCLINDPAKLNSPNVVDTLIDVLVQPIRSSLLFQVRALEACCRSPKVVEHIYNPRNLQHSELRKRLQDLIAGWRANPDERSILSIPEKLCWKLQSIVTGDSPRQTTKMYAASTLHALLCFGGEVAADAKASLQGMVQEHIDPARFMGPQEYVWREARDMLDKLRQLLGLPVYEKWGAVPIRGDDGRVTKTSTTRRQCS